MIRKLAILPVLFGFSCVVAGLYGALHNQISYSVGPDYFHNLKFLQFRIPDALYGRGGAALVGWKASWWMGLVLGLPIGIVSMLMPTGAAQVRAFIWATLIVVISALALGSGSLLFPMPVENYDLFAIPGTVSDEAGFVAAAVMHSLSYLGGLIGGVLALILTAFWAWRAHRR